MHAKVTLCKRNAVSKATMNASITDIARSHFAKRSHCFMHVFISPGDINSYRVNEQKISYAGFANISAIKTPCSGKHATTYTVPVAVLTFKVIQSE